MLYPSPLRYPGGKSSLSGFLAETLRLNGIEGGIYIEPFGGGAGAALNLLFSERASEIHINDRDPFIYSFWKAVLDHTDDFLRVLEKVSVTVHTWEQQKAVLLERREHSTFEVGFATFFLNRCNRSGAPNGGPIGGLDQSGEYKIDARFNKRELKARIEKISLYRDRIKVWNYDAVAFLKTLFGRLRIDPRLCLVYMDPPYFRKGRRLYKFRFGATDHERLADYLNSHPSLRWLISYDNKTDIHDLYFGSKKVILMNYSFRHVRVGREVVISSPNCAVPMKFPRRAGFAECLRAGWLDPHPPALP